MRKLSLLILILISNFIFSSDDNLEHKLEILELKNTILQLEKELLEERLKNIKVASNKKPADNKPKPQQKRKNPNPDFVHDLPIGGSVVMGNPNARVTITEFTDFQ